MPSRTRSPHTDILETGSGKVLVFGVFDGFHDGHKNFLEQARSLGEYLVVVVARDTVVTQLKGRAPRLALAERMHVVLRDESVNEVVPGDAMQGSWEVLKTHQPSVVALGYDQEAIGQELKRNRDRFRFSVTIRMTKAYRPERYNSRLLFP